jgi:hypothetical protein
LLAVTLLYAPLAGTAWLACSMNKMDCCAGGFCPMAAHRHHKQQGAPTKDSSPMDCGHDMGGMAGKMECSMACCHDPARPALIPVAFLLPAPASIPSAVEVLRPMQLVYALELSRFVQPLSPPPRFAA